MSDDKTDHPDNVVPFPSSLDGPDIPVEKAQAFEDIMANAGLQTSGRVMHAVADYIEAAPTKHILATSAFLYMNKGRHPDPQKATDTVAEIVGILSGLRATVTFWSGLLTAIYPGVASQVEDLTQVGEKVGKDKLAAYLEVLHLMEDK